MDAAPLLTLDLGSAPDLGALDAEMWRTGCFQVTNHGVPQQLLDACFEFSRVVFEELTEAELQRYDWNATPAKW